MIDTPIIEGLSYMHLAPNIVVRERARVTANRAGNDYRRQAREKKEAGVNVEAKLYKSTKQLIKKGFTQEYINKQLHEWFGTHYSEEEIAEYADVIHKHTKGVK